jgi:peptidoglycan/xylan/chitin deacetylase (PgdA/CDA1 family)
MGTIEQYQRYRWVVLLIIFCGGVLVGWMLRDLQLRLASPSGPTPVAIAISTATNLPATNTPVPFIANPIPTEIITAAPIAPSSTPTTFVTVAPALAIVAPPDPTITATSVPTAETNQPCTRGICPDVAIVGYSAHTLQPGETIEQIAELGGSNAELVRSYNNLRLPVLPGRALIIPRLAGRTSQLQNTPTLISHGTNSRTLIALTLDAGGASEPTPAILAALRERNLQVTFFLTGDWIAKNPELARQIVADGHEIANHTTSHPDLRELSDAEIQRELATTDQRMREITGAGTRPFFRPPYGAYNQRVLQVVQSEGYLPIYWTLDSLDSVGEPKSPAFLIERVTTKLPSDQLAGAIILMHCGFESTAEALPAILDRFAAMGYTVTTISQVLEATE